MEIIEIHLKIMKIKQIHVRTIEVMKNLKGLHENHQTILDIRNQCENN